MDRDKDKKKTSHILPIHNTLQCIAKTDPIHLLLDRQPVELELAGEHVHMSERNHIPRHVGFLRHHSVLEIVMGIKDDFTAACIAAFLSSLKIQQTKILPKGLPPPSTASLTKFQKSCRKDVTPTGGPAV